MNDNNAQPLWQPSLERIKASHFKRLTETLERELALSFDDYQWRDAWSIEKPDIFWAQI